MLASVNGDLTPWRPTSSTDDGRAATNGGPVAQPSKEVEWYQPEVKSLPPSTLAFFEDYVGIRGEAAIKQHIYNVRDIAWQV